MRFWREKVWLAPLAVAATVSLTGWWCDSEVRQAVEQQIVHELDSLIASSVTALDVWIDDQLRFVETLASEEKIQSLIAAAGQVSQENAEAKALRSYKEVQEIRRYLEDRLRALRLGFVVINPDGIIIAVGPEEMLGYRLQDEAREKFQHIFESGEPVLLTPYKPARMSPNFRRAYEEAGRRRHDSGRRGEGEERSLFRSRNAVGPMREGRGNGGEFRGAGRLGGGRGSRTIMAVAAPIRAAGDQKVIAALGLIIEPRREFTRILSVAQPGDSGETFAFSSDGVMLSQSRFEKSLSEWGLIERGDGSALTLELRDPGGNLAEGYEPKEAKESWPLTLLVRNAVAGGKGKEVKRVRDYRGVPVVGAWQWLPDHQFGVITKLDAEEAFKPLRSLRLIFLILLLLSILCGVGLFLFSYFNVALRRRMVEATLEAKELGQYTLIKKIGEGGMGSVYQARHALLRRDTAVKLLMPDNANEKAIRYFEREAQLSCRLVHPNTVRIFDYGHTPDGIFYYAMEFIDGVNLQELIQMEGRLSEGRVIHILQQVCASLSEAHEAGLVHRDIKPANVILCNRGGMAEDMVKVLDFGLAKPYPGHAKVSTEVSHSLTIDGTPQFISPEAVSQPEQVDHRSDIYAVGALGYYLLTGRNVFNGESAFEVLQKHLSSTPEPPRQRLGVAVEDSLEKSIMKCLEKESSNRPQSAQALIAILRSSSAYQTWTDNQASEWWKEFRERRAARPRTDSPATAVSEPTLQIQLDQRTRMTR